MRAFRVTSSYLSLAGLLMTALLSAAPVQAQERGVQVVYESSNDNPSWYVRVKVDHKDAIYQVGDEMKISVISERAGFLYLFYLDANELTKPEKERRWLVLFPNKAQKDNRIPEKTEIPVPAPEAKFRLRVTRPTGKEVLMALVTLKPLEGLKVDDLNKADVTPISAGTLKGLALELMGGGDASDSLQRNKEKLKQKPREYLENSRNYSGHYIFTQVVENRAAAQQGKSNRLGLFIGISQFQDTRIRKLRCSHLDAEKMAETMKRYGGLTAEPIVLTNDKATLKNIEKAITRELVERTRPGDTVIIYWSGHGGRCAATKRDKNDPDHEPDGFDEFLVPYDGKLDDIDTMRTTMLMDDTFGRWVQTLDGRKVIVVLDACHSGGQASTPAKSLEDFGKGIGTIGAREGGKYKDFFFSTELDRLSKDIKQKDAAVLASSKANQVSFERREGDLSVMTYYLIDQLNSSRGAVTLQEAYDNLKGKVPAYVEKEFPGTTQTPLFAGEIAPTPYVKP